MEPDQMRALEDLREAHAAYKMLEEHVAQAREQFDATLDSARSSGLSLAAIGEAIGLSKQRIHQLTR